MISYITISYLCLITYINGDLTPELNGIDIIGLNKLLKLNNPHFVETFNNENEFAKKWKLSKATKDGIEGDLAKYDGDWLLDTPLKHSLNNDYGLLFKQRVKHRAISAYLFKEYNFLDKPFILQYDILFQEGQECGGGYIKLITGYKNDIKLEEFNDKTPYTIMFGPDKCGSSSKIHFIFRHKNPLNGSFEEKHCKPVTTRFDEIFTDGKPHLFTLIISPDNSFKILLDNKIINEGSLLEDFTPPVNPPAEIDDPNDTKPADWDDRQNIPDPQAVKPDEWDEDAPHMIPDPTAVKPDNWLDYEPLYIKDPSAEKPHDWDIEIDGEWEAPLVPNPACEDATGCGDWTPPKINNPSYKGKWSAPLIPNPEFKGKWTPKKIQNKYYFQDQNPFKMEKIGAVGFELWSISSHILFDNILITDSEEFAKKWKDLTFEVKLKNIEKSSDSLFTQFLAHTNQHPWLWSVYTVILLIITTLLFYCCFWKVKSKDGYEHKKTDSPQSDDNAEDAVTNIKEQPIDLSTTEKCSPSNIPMNGEDNGGSTSEHEEAEEGGAEVDN